MKVSIIFLLVVLTKSLWYKKLRTVLIEEGDMMPNQNQDQKKDQ